MVKDLILAGVFPGRESHIQELRQRDKRFDEICLDYLQIWHWLEAAKARGNAVDHRFISYLSESLTELRNEIETHLLSSRRQNNS